MWLTAIHFDVNMSHSEVFAAVSQNEDGCMKFEINVSDDVKEMMMSNSQITVRVADGVKVLWKVMADQDGRSMSNYLERLLLREKERMEDGSVTLDTLNIKLDNLMDCFSENKKRGTKNSEGKEKKLTAFDVWEDLGVCKKESWDNLIKHFYAMGMGFNPEEAKKRYFNQLCKFDKEGWDCNLIIEYVIDHGNKKVFVPDEWIKQEARR